MNNPKTTNPRTTTLGIVTILIALGTAAKAYLTGQFPDLPGLVSAVTAGVGLITAKDA